MKPNPENIGPQRSAPMPRIYLLGASTAGALYGSICSGQIDLHAAGLYPTVGAANGCASGDFNDDGWIDLAVASDGGVSILLNQRGEGFAPPWTIRTQLDQALSIIAGDFNGDDRVDLVWRGFPTGIEIWVNTGTFDQRTIRQYRPDPIRALVAGDFDRDGIDQIALAQGSLRSREVQAASVSIVRFTGEVFELERQIFLDSSWALDIASGDMDGDGDIDLAVLKATSIYSDYSDGRYKTDAASMQVLFNVWRGDFTPGTEATLPYSNEDPRIPRDLEAGDFDNDGDLDFALTASGQAGVVEPPARLHVIESSNRAQNLREVKSFFLPSQRDPVPLAVADLDGDGDLDILSGDEGDDALVTFTNEGSGAFVQNRDAVGSDLPLTNLGVGAWGSTGEMSVLAGDYRGVTLLENLAAPPRPGVELAALQRGSETEIRIRGVAPGSRVRFFASTQGVSAGRADPATWGLCLDLSDPAQLVGQAVTGANGVARLRVRLPLTGPSGLVAVQALVQLTDPDVEYVKSTVATGWIIP